MTKDNRILTDSQNFLKSPVFIKSLINKTSIGPRDLVVEIGPGKGIITHQLAIRTKRVVAVEIDAQLANHLQKKFAAIHNVEITKANFLQWDLPKKPYKVFANIPFNTTTDIITKLCHAQNPPQAAYLIIQKQAAERFIGKPLAKNTQISILLKPWFKMAIAAQIDKTQFTPIPQVDAVLAVFEKRPQPLINPQLTQSFRDFVVYGYNQWKPSAASAFKEIFSPKQQSLLEKQINLRQAKPRDLSINQWLTLFDTFDKYVPDEKKAPSQRRRKKAESPATETAQATPNPIILKQFCSRS